jgi:TRAP-type C4-dicarboxylate transport system substrate-binding protein
MKTLARCASFVLALALLPLPAMAEPIKLKLSFFTSDRSQTYQKAVKPFVDAVNREGKGLLEIEVYFSGTLGRLQAEQPQLVREGVADMAVVVPGQAPDLFPDTGVIELPGLFRDAREATLTYTRLVAANALRGYGDFFPIGNVSADPNSIHSRNPLASIADLKDMRLRTNNRREAAALEKLGAVPVVLAIILTSETIGSGTIEGSTLAPSALRDFGIGRVTTNHYILPISASPLALLMSRAKFNSLPKQAQALIRKYSGEWLAARFIEGWAPLERQELERLRSEPRRKVVMPSPADLEIARHAFASVIEEWAAISTRHRELLTLVDAELAKIRSAAP